MSKLGMLVNDEMGELTITVNDDGCIDFLQKNENGTEDHIVFHPSFVIPVVIGLLTIINEDPMLTETP